MAGPGPASSVRSSTLVEALRQSAAQQPDAEHLVLLDGDGEAERLSFAQLLAGAEAVARGLRGRGVEPRETVALMLPTGFDFSYAESEGIVLCYMRSPSTANAVPSSDGHHRRWLLPACHREDRPYQGCLVAL